MDPVFSLPLLDQLVPSAAASPVTFPVPDGWSRFNPSIATAEDGYRMIVRSSNYTIDRQLRYTINDPAGVIRTINYLLTLDPELALRRVQVIDDRAVRPAADPIYPVAGLEDCRLFRYRGEWWASVTTREHNPAGVCQIGLVRLIDDCFADLRLLNDPRSEQHEKNWMPLVRAETLEFVYSCRPTTILRYDDTTGTVAPIARRPGPSLAADARGGSQAIAIDGGFLCAVHESIDFDDNSRVYPHRFLRLNDDLAITHASPQFYFFGPGVEFCAGLARRDDLLVASFARRDSDAYLATMRLDEVLALLQPVADSPIGPDEENAEWFPVLISPADAPTLGRGSDAAEPPGGLAAPTPAPPAPPDLGSDLAVGPTSVPVEAPATVLPQPTPAPTTSDPSRPWLVSVTLTGSNRDLIGDALGSVVDWVDACLVIDTGAEDDTLAVARAVAGDKLVVRAFPWVDDFAAARNFALAAAAELGASWAIVLDTDERIDPRGLDFRAAAAAAGEDIIFVLEKDATYPKERLFRLPARGRYVGATHEFFRADGESKATLPAAVFDEVAKSEEGYRRKFERDVAILTLQIAAEPNEPRWPYYLGDALAGLRRFPEAIAAFRACAALKGWDEEAAWACYREAECWLALDNPNQAVESCAVGLARHAGLPELPWLAGFASWQAGRPAQTAYWARLAIALGHPQGHAAAVPRHGFRHPPAQYEGPYDLLRFALRALGDEPGAADAERRYLAALAARRATLGQG